MRHTFSSICTVFVFLLALSLPEASFASETKFEVHCNVISLRDSLNWSQNIVKRYAKLEIIEVSAPTIYKGGTYKGEVSICLTVTYREKDTAVAQPSSPSSHPIVF